MSIEDLIISPEQELPRTAGVHVSGIINYLSRTLGRRDNDLTRTDLDHFALLGRLFEVILAKSMFRPPRYARIGELEVEGIIGSPDAYDVDEGVVVEMKCTWKSSSHDIVTFREYFWQLQAYCHMCQVDRACLVVLHICGDWKPPLPQLKGWDITFTKSELESNWAMLQNNAQASVAHAG